MALCRRYVKFQSGICHLTANWWNFGLVILLGLLFSNYFATDSKYRFNFFIIFIDRFRLRNDLPILVSHFYPHCVMREKGERVRGLSERRKGGGRILIQTESVYNIIRDTLLYARTSFDLSETLQKVWKDMLSRFALLYNGKKCYYWLSLI